MLIAVPEGCAPGDGSIMGVTISLHSSGGAFWVNDASEYRSYPGALFLQSDPIVMQSSRERLP